MKKLLLATTVTATLSTGIITEAHAAESTQQTQKDAERSPEIAKLLDKNGHYKVVEGDTLNKLSKKFKVKVSELRKWNHIPKKSNLIVVDQKLKVDKYGVDPAKLTTATVGVAYNTQANYNTSSASYKATASEAPVVAKQSAVAHESAAPQAQAAPQPRSAQPSAPAAGGSTKAQFLAAGGTEAMWNSIVMPESGGNPNAYNPAGYSGLGQTNQSWGRGSVETQTKGMLNYAQSRYGSVDRAISFRQANGWW